MRHVAWWRSSDKECAECGTFTNHTTKGHEQAMRILCIECHEVEVKDEDERCGECISAMAEYYQPDEGGNE